MSDNGDAIGNYLDVRQELEALHREVTTCLKTLRAAVRGLSFRPSEFVITGTSQPMPEERHRSGGEALAASSWKSADEIMEMVNRLRALETRGREAYRAIPEHRRDGLKNMPTWEDRTKPAGER